MDINKLVRSSSPWPHVVRHAILLLFFCCYLSPKVEKSTINILEKLKCWFPQFILWDVDWISQIKGHFNLISVQRVNNANRIPWIYFWKLTYTWCRSLTKYVVFKKILILYSHFFLNYVQNMSINLFLYFVSKKSMNGPIFKIIIEYDTSMTVTKQPLI